MPMDRSTLSPYRWVIEVLIFLALLSQTLTWLAPAPLLDPIMRSLHISLGNAGVMISPPGTLTMQWFGEGEWPYINMINALCAYIGLTAVFSITAPLYLALGSSWQRVVMWYGIGVAVIALAWT